MFKSISSSSSDLSESLSESDTSIMLIEYLDFI